MTYYAVCRSKPNDELTHWKYIKKKKINGKWRYFYNQAELDEYNKKSETGDISLKDRVKNIANGLVAKGEKFVYNKLFKNKIVKKSNNDLVDKGRTFVNNLFNKSSLNNVKDIVKNETEKKHKYIAKVKTPNGKTRYFYKQEEYDAYLKRLQYQKNEPDFMKGVKKIDKDTVMNAEEDQSATNPKYSPYNDKYSENCIKCTAVYELRRRGYDVEAGAKDSKQHDWNLDNWYKNAKHYEIDNDGSLKDVSKSKSNVLVNAADYFYRKATGKYNSHSYTGKDIKKALEKNNPPGSRGNINVVWKGGGKHSMTYEINSNGKAIVRDCQTNDTYKTDGDFDVIARNTGHAEIVRTDNLELRKEILDNVKQ